MHTNQTKHIRNILIVDDSRVVLRTLQLILDNNDFNVWSAETAEDALGLFQTKGLPDLAIVDLHLPRMNGFWFCKKA